MYSLFSIIVSIYGNIVIRLKNSVKIRKLVLNLLIILIILDTLCRTWYCIVYITEKNILYKFYNTIGLLGIYIWALLCNLFILFVLSNSKVIYYDERINLTDLINLDSPAWVYITALYFLWLTLPISYCKAFYDVWKTLL